MWFGRNPKFSSQKILKIYIFKEDDEVQYFLDFNYMSHITMPDKASSKGMEIETEIIF